ncbi:hypothetical protein HDV00_011441 [Rhizophlyctis rosea]|nr:hypothetical protein HDV00_011441 [Rhizophlyctis rosea]
MEAESRPPISPERASRTPRSHSRRTKSQHANAENTASSYAETSATDTERRRKKKKVIEPPDQPSGATPSTIIAAPHLPQPQPSTDLPTQPTPKRSKSTQRSKSRSRPSRRNAHLTPLEDGAPSPTPEPPNTETLARSPSKSRSRSGLKASAFGSVMSVGADEVWDEEGGRVLDENETARETETDWERKGGRRRKGVGSRSLSGRSGRSDTELSKQKPKKLKPIQLKSPTTDETVTIHPTDMSPRRDRRSRREELAPELGFGSVYGSQMMFTVPEPPLEEVEEEEEEEDGREERFGKGVDAVFVDEGGMFRKSDGRRPSPSDDLEAALNDPSWLDTKMLRLARRLHTTLHRLLHTLHGLLSGFLLLTLIFLPSFTPLPPPPPLPSQETFPPPPNQSTLLLPNGLFTFLAYYSSAVGGVQIIGNILSTAGMLDALDVVVGIGSRGRMFSERERVDRRFRGRVRWMKGVILLSGTIQYLSTILITPIDDRLNMSQKGPYPDHYGGPYW